MGEEAQGGGTVQLVYGIIRKETALQNQVVAHSNDVLQDR